MALKTIIEKLGKLWKLGVLLTLLIILGSWLPEIASGLVGDYFNKGQGGIVIVDSPEVYSRERLINDRFRQVAWLEDELDKSPELAFGNQAISDLHQMMRLDTTIGGGKLNDEGGGVEQKDRDGSAGSNGEADRNTTVSPSERFRDIRAYREEIRTEMMETLLDDRHDIKGNTLYRLKFDTTVLPEENTEKFAVIQVKLARAEFCEPGSSPIPQYLPLERTPEHTPCISIEAIHENWIKLTEEKINNAIEGTIKSFRRSSLPTAEFAEFVRYLQVKVSKPLNFWAKNLDDWIKVSDFRSDCVGQARKNFPRKLSKSDNNPNKRVDINEAKREQEIRSCPREPVSSFFASNSRPDPEVSARYHNVRKLLLRYYDENLKSTNAYSNFRDIQEKFSDLNYDTLIGNNRGKSALYKDIRALIVKAASTEQVVPKSGEKTVADEIAERISGDIRTKIVEAAKSEEEEKKHLREIEAELARQVDRKIKDLIVEAEVAEQLLLRYAVVNMWIDRYTYEDGVKIKECQNLYRHQLEVFDPKSLSCIAHLEKTKSCADVDYCTVRVQARFPDARRKNIEKCDDEVKKRELYDWGLHDWCIVRKVFEGLLRIDEAYYSYAVTPKESAQRVLTIASERRQKQLALSLIASSAKGLDPETVSSITRAISESASQMEQIQRKPLILSFGRGQPVIQNGSEHRGIDFGWILGPKFLFSDRSKGEIRFRHTPVQNSLSAVISVPSWWTAINLEIDTCWVDQDQLSQMRPALVQGFGPEEDRNFIEGLCDVELTGSRHNVDIDYVVRLPGSVEELPRKFGYEIERVPAITGGGKLADFYVGQENASLIIQGNELWRSTVVTMGHQKADNIEVLPNMKGILATFRKVDIPSEKIEHDPKGERGRPVDCFVQSEIVVWTSEGRTPEGQLFARIHANPDSRTGKGNVPPEGFGKCFDPPENQG